jgi:hypothetical protein
MVPPQTIGVAVVVAAGFGLLALFPDKVEGYFRQRQNQLIPPKLLYRLIGLAGLAIGLAAVAFSILGYLRV